MATTADSRQTACRYGIASRDLEGQLDGARFVEGEPCQAGLPVVDLYTQEDDAAPASQLLYGEDFEVFGAGNNPGNVWGRSLIDGYVGFVKKQGLKKPGPTNVFVGSAFASVLERADLKSKPTHSLPFLSRLQAAEPEGGYRETSLGFVHERHLVAPEGDIATIAGRFVGAPYVWGGRSPLGLDCSALVQLVLLARGIDCPRDSDMQFEAVGRGLHDKEVPERNDLIFWKGHVGIITGSDSVLHANAHHMQVVEEGLEDVITRARKVDRLDPIGIKRIPQAAR